MKMFFTVLVILYIGYHSCLKLRWLGCSSFCSEKSQQFVNISVNCWLQRTLFSLKSSTFVVVIGVVHFSKRTSVNQYHQKHYAKRLIVGYNFTKVSIPLNLGNESPMLKVLIGDLRNIVTFYLSLLPNYPLRLVILNSEIITSFHTYAKRKVAMLL